MDALKAEIMNKRKTWDEGGERPTKYMRRGDVERMKEEQERKAKAEKEALNREEKARIERERSSKDRPIPHLLLHIQTG